MAAEKKQPAPPAKDAKPAASQKFVPPPEWRGRCEVYRVTSQNRAEYIPLHVDLMRALLEVKSIDFRMFFLVGWDLFEFIRPADFSVDLVKEMLDVHKKWPQQTHICVKSDDQARFEKVISAFRKQRFIQAAAGAEMALTPAFSVYAELSNASQLVMRGALTEETFARVAAAASSAVIRMPATKHVLQFLSKIPGRDPVIYDHGAVTAYVASALAWNSLKLNKRDSKLVGQAALMHDVERHCAYLFKAAVPGVVSSASVKDVQALQAAGVGFHDSTIRAMEQYREKFGGGGYPGAKANTEEYDPTGGISRAARLTSIGCAFAEYLLKRQDKHPLQLATILGMIEKRGGSDFDPDILAKFAEDMKSGQMRKPNERPPGDFTSDDDDDDF